MKYILKKISATVALIIIILMSFSVLSFAESKNTKDTFKGKNNSVICIAHRGEAHAFPENSLEAVKAASVYDGVSVDLKVTADGNVVLMADETVDRMCADKNGNAVTGTVSEMTYEQISALRLRSTNGSTDKGVTDCIVPTVEQVYKEVGNSTILVLNTSLNDFDKVYEHIEKINALDNVVFRIDAKTKDIVNKVKEKNKDITVTGNYQGNIIFMAINNVKLCADNGINTIEMGSTNGHGVLYDNFLMKRFEKPEMNAMVSMVNGRCGKRQDNETGWDDLISRGYNIIETDYPAELKDYIIELNNARNELSRTVDLYENTELEPYTTDTENEFLSSLENAKLKLSQKSSLSELDDARYKLQSSYSNLTVGEKKAVTLKLKLSAGRMITLVLCLAVFIASQVYLFKKRANKRRGNQCQ